MMSGNNDGIWLRILAANPDLEREALDADAIRAGCAFAKLQTLLRAEDDDYSDQPEPPAVPPDSMPLPGTAAKVTLMARRVRTLRCRPCRAEERSTERYAALIRVLRNGAIRHRGTVDEVEARETLPMNLSLVAELYRGMSEFQRTLYERARDAFERNQGRMAA